jgi:hypothetical protein
MRKRRSESLRRYALVVALAASLVGASTINASAQSPNCPGAVPNDAYSDTVAINECLAGGGTVVLAHGNYWLDDSLLLNVDYTHLTGEVTESGGAVISAMNGLWAPMLYAPAGTDNYEIDNIAFDGRKYNRTTEYLCDTGTGSRVGGSNLILRGTGYHVHYISSVNALCGSAMEVVGDTFEIDHNQLLYNGIAVNESHTGDQPWADGLTLLECISGHVHHNLLVDNTDVDLIEGGGNYCTVEYNEIDHVDANGRHGFAGLMIGHFNGTYPGYHGTSHFQYNAIYSYQDQLAFGIMVGNDPWIGSSDPTQVPDAGFVVNNTVEGAVVNLAIDGIQDGYIVGNTLSNHQGTYGFHCSASYDYTAAHKGSAIIDSGSVSFNFDGGTCGF